MIHAPREGRRIQEKAKGFRAHLQVCLNHFEYFEVRILLKWTNTSCAYPSSIFRSNLKYLQMCWLGSSPKAVGQPSSEEEEEVTRKRSEKDGERWAEAIYCNFQWCWVYYHIQLIYYTPDTLHHLTISYNYVGCSASLVWAGLRFCGDFCQIFCCVFFCLKAYPCYCMTAMLRLCMLWSHCSSGLPMIPQTLMKRIFQNGCQQSVGGPSIKKYKQKQKSREMSSGRAKMTCRCLYLL